MRLIRSATVVLPVPGRPVNDMCRRGGGLETHLLAGPVDHQQGSDLTDPGLHRPQTHQIPIQLIEHRLNAGPFMGSTQIDPLIPPGRLGCGQGGGIAGGHLEKGVDGSSEVVVSSHHDLAIRFGPQGQIHVGAAETDVGKTLAGFTEIVEPLEKGTGVGVGIELDAPLQRLGPVGLWAGSPGLVHGFRP